MPSKQIEKSIKAVIVDNRCQYNSSSGRRCRNLAARDTSRASGLSNFCVSHSQLEQQYINTKSVTKELLGEMDNFRTAVAVNDVLGRLFVLQAENRIPIRNAMALAYTAQVILSSIDAVREEVINAEGEDSHRGIIQKAIDSAYEPLEKNDEEDAEQDDKGKAGEESAEDEKQETKPESELEDLEQMVLKPNPLLRALKALDGR
jgi:hypothetical protein